jgi:AraC family transcriptional regulator of adaptative response / DNA-3-methyladenine glycosylase II
VDALAAELGVTDRHLRRVVRSELGVSLVELAQTQRLLLAKRLLTDTDLPITEVAFASGFGSLRRFNTLFHDRYRLRPGDLRRKHTHVAPGTGTEPQDTLTCEVAFRPPMAWQEMLAFLARRAITGVEVVEGGRYCRTARWKDRRGWIAVCPSATKPVLRVTLSASLAPALQPVLARVKRLFDTAADPCRIADHLGELAGQFPGLRVPGAFDGFETAVRAILGQQITVKAATTLAGRFAAAFGEPIDTPIGGLTHLTPSAARIAGAEPAAVAAIGLTASRAASLVALSRAVDERRVTLEPGPDPEQAMARLRELPGVGEWTAQYLAMRALAWPDAFPHGDLGVRRAMGVDDPREVLRIAESWRPWRAYATIHLWRQLETGRS